MEKIGRREKNDLQIRMAAKAVNMENNKNKMFLEA